MSTEYNGDVDALFEQIIELGIATAEELSLITAINGYSLETLRDVIYVRTGSYTIDDDEPDDEPKEDHRGCEDCPPDECMGHCMSCYYRPV